MRSVSANVVAVFRGGMEMQTNRENTDCPGPMSEADKLAIRSIPASMFEPKVTRPAFRYYGGKWNLAPWIISKFPRHQHYVEPCGGAASVLLQKSPSAIETYNDLSGDVVNFFKIVRERPEELAYAIEWTPWARSEYEQAKASYEGDDLERARRFWIYQMMSVGADPGKGSNSGMRIENKVVKERWERLDRKQVVDGIFATAKRLRTVQIESRPMNELLMRLDSRIALFYIDPPYVSGTRTHGKDMYGVEWSDSDHAEFIEIVQNLEGFCIISGYACELYEPLERAGWHREDKKALNNSGDTRTESLWLCPKTVADRGGCLF